jgi:hypothetical protein
MEDGIMNASVKKSATAPGARTIIGLAVAAVLIAVAASGWASAVGTSQVAASGGHYNLQPVW